MSSIPIPKEKDERIDRVASSILKDKVQAQELRFGDAALAVLDETTIDRQITPKEDARVLQKIDLWVLPVIILVYFFQQLDKSSVSYTSVFGLVDQAHLVGSQYSWLNSIVYLAELVWQPVSSIMLVKLPISKALFTHVVMWGVIVSCTAAAKDFKGLLATRFFLGIFEASVAPAFITITQMWWRRREQSMRLSFWYAANGITGIVGSLLTYGLGHIHGSLRSYQIIFLFIGVVTIAFSPIILFVLPDSPTTARFLTQDEKVIALERLRANNQGTENKVWKWEQVWDAATDPKTYMWVVLFFLCALPSGGVSAFGPLIIQGFGFDQFHTILLSIPFFALSVISILLSGYVCTKIKLKWPVVFVLCLPLIAAAAALLVLPRGPKMKGKLLGCYYVLSMYTALQPMLYTWSAQNTAGHTKKLCTTGLGFVAQCTGNIVGPLLYKTADKPFYHAGLVANLVCWILLSFMTVITAVFLAFRNRQHAAIRESLGKSGMIIDTSLEKRDAETHKQARNDQSFNDLTDSQNEDFIFVL
ncbi:MFS general substrate transporter [Tricholoma matsutake]|nr:MFS general substrate transporter [Tricholoma matsutake 945]